MNKSKLRLIRSSSNVEPSRKPKKFTRDENLMPSANYVYPSPLGQIPETDYPILPRAKSANSLLPINGHVSLKIIPKFRKKNQISRSTRISNCNFDFLGIRKS